MMKKVLVLAAVCVAAVFTVQLAGSAWAQESGRAVIIRMNDTKVEGEIKKLPDGSYEVKSKGGITTVVRANEIKKIIPLGEQTEASTGAKDGSGKPDAAQKKTSLLRREISLAEINELIEGIVVDTEDAEDFGGDADGVPPTNTTSVEYMKSVARTATRTPEVLEKDHFVLVYTSSKQDAQELAARLESIYRWNQRFAEMMGLKFHRPEYKLEMYYFATHDEYKAYGSTLGFPVEDALGFYEHKSNRSCFFDMKTLPGVARILEQLKDKRIEYHVRQYWRNKYTRYMDFLNLTVIQHEAAHHIHFNTGIFNARENVPTWFVEGLAQMFELPPTAAGGSLGAVNHARLKEFHMIYGAHPRALGDLRLFIANDGMWQGGRSYSLGWALQQYLYKESRDKYLKYIQLLSRREDGQEMDIGARQKEFEDLFGTIDEKWIEKFHNYVMKKLQLKESVLPDLDR